MSWFRRRHRDDRVFDTGHEGDDELLAEISRHSDLDNPRHWVHYLYFRDRVAAEQAAGDIRAGGWQIQTVEPAPQGPDWAVVAEKHGAVTSPAAVQEARAFFERIATEARGQYDGWEAEV